MSLVVELLDLRVEEKMRRTKIAIHKAIELVSKMDLINSISIEGIIMNRGAVKIFLQELIQQQEEEKCTMTIILIIQEVDPETII
jgi:hypothetical protein